MSATSGYKSLVNEQNVEVLEHYAVTIDDDGQGLLWVRWGRGWKLHSTHRTGSKARAIMATLLYDMDNPS